MEILSKQPLYQSLVNDRKNCRLCSTVEMRNPDEINKAYDSDQVGPWTQWQGDLDASLMIVGQDWGGEKYFIKIQGREEDTNPTNRNLCELLRSIGFSIELPNQPQSITTGLFFTNAVLCCKRGGLVGPVPSQAVGNCSRHFLARQIELVRPKAVATLGYEAYRSVCYAYGYFPVSTISEAIASPDLLTIGYGSTLVPVHHCGHYGTSRRRLTEHKHDWQRIATVLRNWEPKPSRLSCSCYM